MDKIENILFFTQYSSFYGASQSLFTLVTYLERKGFKCIVVTPTDGPLVERLREENIETYIIPFTPWVFASKIEKKILKKILNITKRNLFLIKKNFRAILKIKEVVGRHKIDLIYTNMAITHIGFICSRLFRLPHVWHLRSFVDLDFGLQWNLGSWLSKKIINCSDIVIANSHAVRKHYLNKKNKINVVYNGVISEKELKDIENGKINLEKKDKSNFTFAIIGRIYEPKGQHVAVRAFAMLLERRKDIQLYIVGEGNSNKINSLIEDLGIQNYVVFTGHIDFIFDIYPEIDAVLVCSKNEAFGRVTAEAMIGKKPVIGNKSGATEELIEHGITGLHYNRNPDSLVKQMETLIDSPELNKKIVENAFKKAKKNFLNSDYVNSVYSILKFNFR